MLDLTKPHNWVALLLAMLLIGFVLNQIGNRVPMVKRVATASGLGA